MAKTAKKQKRTPLEAAAAAARLDEEQARQICQHVKLLGLTANRYHSNHIKYFAKEFDRSPETIQTFVRVAVKDQTPVSGAIGLNDPADGGGLMLDENGRPVTSGSIGSGPSPSFGSVRPSAQQIESLRTTLSELQSQVNNLQTGNKSGVESNVGSVESLSIPALSIVLQKSVFDRKLPAPSVYSQYQQWAKDEVKNFNRDGLSSDIDFKTLNVTQWEATKKSATGQSLYHQILEMNTVAHADLCAKWRSEVQQKKESGPQTRTLSSNEVSRVRNQEIKLLRRVAHGLAIKGVELQGCLFNTEDGASMDVSTGPIAKKVSKRLYNSLTSRPPTIFKMVLMKKDESLVKNFAFNSTDRSLEAARYQVRQLLLGKQNSALAQFKQKPSSKVQISKLLSEKGYKGIVMIGYPFVGSKSYSRLTLKECQKLKNCVDDIKFNQVELVNSDDSDVDSESENGSAGGESNVLDNTLDEIGLDVDDKDQDLQWEIQASHVDNTDGSTLYGFDINSDMDVSGSSSTSVGTMNTSAENNQTELMDLLLHVISQNKESVDF